MEISDQEKLKLGLEGLQAFLGQFGTQDTGSKLVLDVLFDELLYYSEKNGKKDTDKKSVPLSNEEGQTGREVDNEAGKSG